MGFGEHVTLPNADHTTQIFEPLEDYLAHSNKYPGYWGYPVESSIDWCERNYIFSFYIAEFWNSLSNVFLIVLGLWGLWIMCYRLRLEMRFYAVFGGIVTIGIGSTAFHATLTHVGQQGDETPMILTILSWWYCLLRMNPETERQHPFRCQVIQLVMCSVGVLYACVHYQVCFVICHQVFFGFVTTAALYSVYRECLRCKDPVATKLGWFYMTSILLAFGFWLIDGFFCVKLHTLPFGIPNPQLHAWWHTLVGFNCYAGPTFLVFQRLWYLKLRPVIHWRCLGCLPCVEILPVELEKRKEGKSN